MIRDGRHLMNEEYRREFFLWVIFEAFAGASQMLRFAAANRERIDKQYRQGAITREHVGEWLFDPKAAGASRTDTAPRTRTGSWFGSVMSARGHGADA